jgi:hypothetical protein
MNLVIKQTNIDVEETTTVRKGDLVECNNGKSFLIVQNGGTLYPVHLDTLQINTRICSSEGSEIFYFLNRDYGVKRIIKSNNLIIKEER